MNANPYADSAPEYLHAGYSPIPLPYGKKHPPLAGLTGYAGAFVMADDVAKFAKLGPRNVGLRLPQDVLGIDVDAYDDKVGAETLAEAEARLGTLPPTWRSTSRDDDPVSGIRLYRVPVGRQWADRVGPDDGNVEVIHHGHRYVVAAPSVHPDRREYGWWDSDGLPATEPPKTDELAELPPAWVAELDRGNAGDRDPKADLTQSDAWIWLEGLSDGLPCRSVTTVLDEAAEAFEEAGSRHNIARRHALRLVRLGEQGHVGVRVGLDTLEAMFAAALAGDRDEGGEWGRMVSGAVALAVASPTPDDRRGCCSTRSTAAEDFAEGAQRLWSATATLSDIRQAARAQVVGPEALLAVVLARVLAELPPRVMLPPVVGGPASLNLGVALVGRSGGGKSALLTVSRRFLGLLGADQVQRERNVGSGEGMAETFLYDEQVVGPRGGMQKTGRKLLIADPRRLLIADEVAQLDAITNRSGATFAPTLRSALTGGALGQENASADRRRHVPEGVYRLVLLLGVQPTRSGALLKDADAGTPQRLVWVPVGDPDAPDDPEPWPDLPDWFLPDELPDQIDYPDHIRAEVRAARLARLRDEDADDREGHMLLLRLKVATALALLHGEVAITDLWWELAGYIVERSMATQAACAAALADEAATSRRNLGRLDSIRAEGAAEYRNERAEAGAAAIWRKVHKHANGAKDGNDQKHEPDEGCTGRCIGKALQNFPDRAELRDAATAHADDAGWIEARGERWFPGESRPAQSHPMRPGRREE